MEKLKPYKVIQNSSDGTFQVGDIIWMSNNGDINCLQARGWITPSEEKKETIDFKCEEDNGYEILCFDRHEICKRK